MGNEEFLMEEERYCPPTSGCRQGDTMAPVLCAALANRACIIAGIEALEEPAPLQTSK